MDGKRSKGDAENARLRAEQVHARTEVDEMRGELERVLAQMREANERLVIATIRADELVDQAEAARAATADEEERFRSLVTTSAAIVWHADARGRIRVEPASWHTFTGLELEDPDLDGVWLAAIHPADRPRLQCAWKHASEALTPYTCQHRIRTFDGTFAHVVSRAVPIFRDGNIREWIGMMTDVSDHVRVEEARELFIAILGHDLRSPLTSILAGADTLGLLESDELRRAIAERIARSAKRMAAIIRDVMDFARGRLGGGIPIAPTTADLGAICGDVVAELRQAHPDRTIVEQHAGDLRGIWDADRAEQVISNLVGNAIAHGTDPITVRAFVAGDEIVTLVHNRGLPIPPAVIRTLFEPFKLGGSETDARTRGLGLGLYIVSEIVRAHGGTIEVSSTEIGGTAFELRWPRHGRPRASVPPPMAA